MDYHEIAQLSDDMTADVSGCISKWLGNLTALELKPEIYGTIMIQSQIEVLAKVVAPFVEADKIDGVLMVLKRRYTEYRAQFLRDFKAWKEAAHD